MSSVMPTMKMARPPTSGRARSRTSPVAIPRTKTVTAIATPPKSGVGLLFHRSLRGRATTPFFNASTRQTGTSAADTARAAQYQNASVKGFALLSSGLVDCRLSLLDPHPHVRSTRIEANGAVNQPNRHGKSSGLLRRYERLAHASG